MKNIKAVIGANFGDEGKGLMTDYLAASCRNGIVVRFNGGAQAGHTVQLQDGRRHVFGHVGSGAFCGLPSYLSNFFVINPMLFAKETAELKTYGMVPEVFADSRCMVTTPYDIMINQIAELSRGSLKHGSCGVGFNETITRCLYGMDFGLYAGDLVNPEIVRQKLYLIKEKYVPMRLAQLGINKITPAYEELLESDGITLCYLVDIANMLKNVRLCDVGIMTQYESILFEGAQGLLLDQDHEYFPHVTRSNTGIKNMVELLNLAGLEHEETEVIYVTRAYMTRHGAGPFPTELPEKPYPRIEDKTNVPNPYQDTLRYGLLDIDALAKTIRQDLKNAGGIRAKLAVTCMDQLEDEVDYFCGTQKVKNGRDAFVEDVFSGMDMKEGYLSFGPTRDMILNFAGRLGSGDLQWD